MLKIAAFPTELFVSGKQWRPRSGLLRIIGWGWKGNRNEDQNWGNLLHIEISQTQSSLRSLIFLKGGRIELLRFYSHIDIHSVGTVAWAVWASWPGSLGEVPLNLNQSLIVALSEGQEISVSRSKESVHQPKSETPLCLLKTLQSNPLGDRSWSLSPIRQCTQRHWVDMEPACASHSHLQVMGAVGRSHPYHIHYLVLTRNLELFLCCKSIGYIKQP